MCIPYLVPSEEKEFSAGWGCREEGHRGLESGAPLYPFCFYFLIGKCDVGLQQSAVLKQQDDMGVDILALTSALLLHSCVTQQSHPTFLGYFLKISGVDTKE